MTCGVTRCRCKPRDIDEVAVERACDGDLSVSLNRAEMAAAFAELDRRGVSLRRTATILGVTDRSVVRWRTGRISLPKTRPGRAS